MLAQGAEATVEAGRWRGRAVVFKRRLEKTYRHAALDQRLRNERTRDEASLLIKARKAGVPVPVVYDVDRVQATLVLEQLEGEALRDHLPTDSDEVATTRLRALGDLVGRLHDAGITHGDLTTSNVFVSKATGSLVLIDFGLGQAAQEAEPRGVDLHLVEEALEATDARADVLMDAFLDGYGNAACAAASVARLQEIRERGRYRDAV